MRKARRIARLDATRKRAEPRARAQSAARARSRVKADALARMAVLDALRGSLRHAGLRCTAPRIAVLDQLQHATAPLSHDQIATPLLAFGFDRATIYRNLTDLAAVDLIYRVEVGDHVHRYEMRSYDAENRHPHFVCTVCGAISCLTTATVTISSWGHLQWPDLPHVSEIIFKGHCDGCTPTTGREFERPKSRPPRS